jgi:prevent-host-death family protein
MVMMKKTMNASRFKATCLEVLDQVARSGHGVIVTKRGKPVARVVPMVNRPDRIVGAMKGEIEVQGDIIGPIDVEWGALKR